MGNDIDVCSKDNLDEIFWEHHGPKDESSIQFFRRGYNKFCDSLSAPKRKEYTQDDLQLNAIKGRTPSMGEYYDILEFPMFSLEVQLQCCLWKRVKFHERYKFNDPDKKQSPLCFIYLHTNTRALNDALEISSLAHELDANILSFDLPG